MKTPRYRQTKFLRINKMSTNSLSKTDTLLAVGHLKRGRPISLTNYQRKQKKRTSERMKILEQRHTREKWLRTKIEAESEGC